MLAGRCPRQGWILLTVSTRRWRLRAAQRGHCQPDKVGEELPVGRGEAEKEEEELRRAVARASGNKENIRSMLAVPRPSLSGWDRRASSLLSSVGRCRRTRTTSPTRGTWWPEDENWILAEVVSFNNSTGQYAVDDIDEEQKEESDPPPHHTCKPRDYLEGLVII